MDSNPWEIGWKPPPYVIAITPRPPVSLLLLQLHSMVKERDDGTSHCDRYTGRERGNFSTGVYLEVQWISSITDISD
jgi:hypothetical protein